MYIDSQTYARLGFLFYLLLLLLSFFFFIFLWFCFANRTLFG